MVARGEVSEANETPGPETKPLVRSFFRRPCRGLGISSVIASRGLCRKAGTAPLATIRRRIRGSNPI